MQRLLYFYVYGRHAIQVMVLCSYKRMCENKNATITTGVTTIVMKI